MVNIFFLIITEVIKHCTMYSGRNYTILNVLWQSKGHVNAKYGHVKITSYFTGSQGPYGRERVKWDERIKQRVKFKKNILLLLSFITSFVTPLHVLVNSPG